MNGVANLALVSQSSVGSISFIDLHAQQRLIRERVEARLKRVLDHGRYVAGPEVEELEEALAAATGAKAALACASGTAALIIPLLGWGVGEGDAVFIPAFTYNATANAVLLTGATPIFVDIDPHTFNMCCDDLERAIGEVVAEGRLRPRVVLPVDLFGSPAEYNRLSDIAAQRGLALLADGAQSYGGAYHGKNVGAIAPVTATSFFPGKALGAYGEGGAVFTNDPADIDAWASIRWHGTDDARKNSVRVGFNGRLDTFQAAILLEKLAIFDAELAARRQIAATYNERFAGVARPQKHCDNAQSGYGYYSLCAPGRDRIVEQLRHMGVPTAIYYSTPLHQMPAFAPYAPSGGLKVCETVAAEIFSLPVHPYLSPAQVEFICDAVEAAIDHAN